MSTASPSKPSWVTRTDCPSAAVIFTVSLTPNAPRAANRNMSPKYGVAATAAKLALLGNISIGRSHIAPHGSHAVAFEDLVDVLVTESPVASMERLSTIRTPRLVALIHAIQSLLANVTDVHRDAVESAIEAAIAPRAHARTLACKPVLYRATVNAEALRHRGPLSLYAEPARECACDFVGAILH